MDTIREVAAKDPKNVVRQEEHINLLGEATQPQQVDEAKIPRMKIQRAETLIKIFKTVQKITPVLFIKYMKKAGYSELDGQQDTGEKLLTTRWPGLYNMTGMDYNVVSLPIQYEYSTTHSGKQQGTFYLKFNIFSGEYVGGDY